MKGTIVAGSHTEGWVTVKVDRAPTGLRLGDAVDVLFGDDAALIVRERDEARAALRQIAEILGGRVSEHASHEFHLMVVEEVRAACKRMRAGKGEG